MKKTVSKLLVALLILSFTVMCFASCGGTTNYAENNTEYYIGASGPLTGGASVYGLAVKNSAQMAVDEINANGGINGKMIKFVIKDDAHKPENVSTTYSSLYEEGMQISLGCVTTAPCLEFKNLSKEDNVFFLTPSASADAVTEFSNAYQMCFADNNQGKVAAQYVNSNFDGKKIGVLYRSDDPYSTGVLSKFEENLSSSLKEGMKKASFTGDVVSSFASQIQLLKNCDLVFMPIYTGPAAQFMDEAKNEISSSCVYYGCDGLDGIDTSVENFDINTIPQEVSFLSQFNSKSTEGPSYEYISKYVKKYGQDTLNQFGASAYDCIYAIAKALTELDKDGKITVTSSPSDICEAMKDKFNNGFKFSGITGTDISWTSDGFVNKVALKYVIKESSAN